MKTTGRIRAWLLALAFLFVLVAALSTPVWQVISYRREQLAGAELIRRLSDRRPESVSSKTWNAATGWAITAYVNVCFSREHVAYDQLTRFNREVEERLSGRVDLKTIDWIWTRLSETGPHGQRYVLTFEPQYREEVYEEKVPGGQ